MDNFSEEWEYTYSKGNHASIWPWSDLVSYVMRYAKPQKRDFKVLELGCGAGANISFFKSLEIEYFAIDGSEYIVNKLHEKYPEFKESIVVADFTTNIPFDEKFDLIVDRASLTHNTTYAIKSCLGLVYQKLLNGGIFIGIDWFSTEHTDYLKGNPGEDIHTRVDISEGQFAGLGHVHFSNQKHLASLFENSKYHFIKMEQKIIETSIPDENHRFASWNFAVRKH